MRILFVNAVLGGDFSALDISITRLATHLNVKTDHKAAIADLVFHRRHWKRYLAREIKRFKPDIIAMSCNTMYMQYIKKVAAFAKKAFRLPVILGGYHVSLKPDETLSIPSVDAICIGDGEFSITEYLDRMSNAKSPADIPGIWYKDKGNIIRNKGGSFIHDIDQFPMLDWDLWKDLEKYFYYLGMLYVIGTMGCPHRCMYCDAHPISKCVNGNYYRIRDPESYACEIHHQWDKYSSKGMRLVQMFDQIPTANRNWLKRFTDEYRKHGNIKSRPYSMFSRVDDLDEEKIKMLASSGCALLRVGVEAGNDFIRNDIYRKNISKKKIYEVFRLCKRYGIGLTAFYMVGGPGESRKTINQTIRFANRLNANRSAFFVFKPFTQESESIINKYGGYIDVEKWSKADNITFDAVVHLKDISPRTVEHLQYKGYFYTFGRRLIWMILENPFKYFARLITYMVRGMRDDLDVNYLLPYYHIYGYDYVRR